MRGWLLIVIFFTCGYSINAFCMNEVEKCMKTPKCNTMFKDVMKKCTHLVHFHNVGINKLRIECKKKCQESIVDILRDYPSFKNCKCNDHKCKVIQHRTLQCSAGKIKGRKRNLKATNGCTRIYQKCELDRTCRAIFNDVPMTCNGLLNGRKCTVGCEEVLMKYFRNPLGAPLMHCECDGTQYYEGICLEIRDRVKAKCKSQDFLNFLKDRQKEVVEERS